ncbi:MAG: hypothetical protein HDT14_02800 [Oscillibacter sp.]|nr:hypothetical protein [Oscillibacter sp.]
MGDLQFKSYLKLLIHSLETIESKETKEEMLQAIDSLKQELESNLRG